MVDYAEATRDALQATEAWAGFCGSTCNTTRRIETEDPLRRGLGIRPTRRLGLAFRVWRGTLDVTDCV